MPNWMSNSITIEGDAASLREIYDAAFDFQVIHPCPFPSDDPDDNKWLRWCYTHWGTKWSPAEPELHLESDTCLRVQCQTPWYAPHTFLAFLTLKYPSLRIRNEYEEENYDKVGFAEYDGGIASNTYFQPHTMPFDAIDLFAEKYAWFNRDSYLELYGNIEGGRADDYRVYTWNDTYEGLITL